jgi:hypothetical protein
LKIFIIDKLKNIPLNNSYVKSSDYYDPRNLDFKNKINALTLDSTLDDLLDLMNIGRRKLVDLMMKKYPAIKMTRGNLQEKLIETLIDELEELEKQTTIEEIIRNYKNL